MIRELAGIQLEPGHWWRVTYSGGIWCETSDEQDAKERLLTVPGGGGTLQRLYVKTVYEWRPDDGATRPTN